MRSYKPSRLLSVFIKEFRIIDNDERFGGFLEKVPPLGFPVLLINYGDDIESFYKEYALKNLPVCSIVGQLTSHASLNPSINTKLIGVDFKPYGLHKLLKTEVFKFTNMMVDASHFFGNEICCLPGAISLAKTDSQKIRRVEEFLEEFAPDAYSIDYFDEITDLIVEKKGRIQLTEIVEKTGKSQRTLERIFKERTGLGPKMFLSIIRHRSVFEMIFKYPDKRFSDIIHECGYFDQSHFIKDFKKISGITPKAFFGRMNIFTKEFF